MQKIPVVVLNNILSFLDVIDVINIERVNKSLNSQLKQYVDLHLFKKIEKSISTIPDLHYSSDVMSFDIPGCQVLYFGELFQVAADLWNDIHPYIDNRMFILICLNNLKLTYEIYFFYDEYNGKRIFIETMSYSTIHLNQLFEYLQSFNIWRDCTQTIKYLPHRNPIVEDNTHIYNLFLNEGVTLTKYQIFRVPNVTQLTINMDPYYRIYIDRADALQAAYSSCLKNKHIYIPKKSQHLDVKMIKYNIGFHGIKNVHLEENVDLSIMDLIICHDLSNINMNYLDTTPYHPDIFTSKSDIDITKYGYTYDDNQHMYVHRSRDPTYVFDILIQQDKLSEFEYILAPHIYINKLIYYRDHNREYGYRLVKYLQNMNIVNNGIIFESYIITWYVKGQYMAEQLILNNINKIKADFNIEQWRINWNFLSDDIKNALSNI